jgi:hypothetical protein
LLYALYKRVLYPFGHVSSHVNKEVGTHAHLYAKKCAGLMRFALVTTDDIIIYLGSDIDITVESMSTEVAGEVHALHGIN